MQDVDRLRHRNEQFIEACRQGSWAMLQPVLSPRFAYLDGVTGEVWSMDRYIADLESGPTPALTIDQVTIHISGHTAVVSARTSQRTGRYNRYVDTYKREVDDWHCVHASVWPLPGAAS